MPHASKRPNSRVLPAYLRASQRSSRSVVYPQRRALSREDPQEGECREEGMGEGLASPINNHGRWRGRRAAVAAKDLLPLPELGPALFEGGSIGVQTLIKYRVIL
jgi:hypothetical protein